MNSVALSLAAATALLSSLPLRAQVSDDFNDGNDAGWIRYNPIGVGSYSFPAGGYRIVASASPSPLLGDGRAGSLRADATLSAFTISVDVLDYDETLPQAFGSLARIGTPNPGATTGYTFVYDNESNDLLIARLDGEVPTTIGVIENLLLDPGNDYRFTFTGNGADFTGELFDLSNAGALFGSVNATDATYASGSSGLVSASLDNAFGADATFDNFVAVPEPAGGMLWLAGALLVARRSRSELRS